MEFFSVGLFSLKLFLRCLIDLNITCMMPAACLLCPDLLPYISLVRPGWQFDEGTLISLAVFGQCADFASISRHTSELPLSSIDDPSDLILRPLSSALLLVES